MPEYIRTQALSPDVDTNSSGQAFLSATPVILPKSDKTSHKRYMKEFHLWPITRTEASKEGQWATMIQLTRLNQKPVTLNSDLIKLVENAPDTVITLISGEKFIVLESVETIVGRVVEFRRRLLDGLLFNGLTSTTQPTLPRQERHHRLDGSEHED